MLRGVRLAKMNFSTVFGSVLQKNCFQFGCSLIKLTAFSDCLVWILHHLSFSVYCMHSIFCRHHLSFMLLCYDARNDVLPYWLGLTNCQLKWLNTLTVDTIMFEDELWMSQRENTHITVPKPLKSVLWKPNCGNRVFGFWILRSFWFSSVFRKQISDIFIGFHTALDSIYTVAMA